MMNKTILMSAAPNECCNILNLLQSLFVRKKFPKDYVGWVYIYCTKGKLYLYRNKSHKQSLLCLGRKLENYYSNITDYDYLNGKVIARFWCDKVEELYTDENGASFYTDTIIEDFQLSKIACIDDDDIIIYLNGTIGVAIHISQLEIFDKPKELSEFKYYKKSNDIDYMLSIPKKETCERLVALTKAPKNYCYADYFG